MFSRARHVLERMATSNQGATGIGAELELRFPRKAVDRSGPEAMAPVENLGKVTPSWSLRVPLMCLYSPLRYLTGPSMILFGVFETSDSAMGSPHARVAQCVVSPRVTMSYDFISPDQGSPGVRAFAGSPYRLPSFIYRAVLILRRRVRLALLGSHFISVELSLPVI
jgi:hypothetical protein